MNGAAIEAGHLQVADDGGIRRIELHRPDKVNALSAGMMSGIARAARDAAGARESWQARTKSAHARCGCGLCCF